MPSGIYLRTEEMKKKMSISAKKRFSNPQNHPKWNTHHSKETRIKISKAHKGIKESKETKIKQKIRMIKEWKNPDSIFNSKEYRKNKGLATQKRWQNPIYRRKMSNNLKQRWKSSIYRKKVSKNISIANKGQISFIKDKTFEEVVGEKKAKLWKKRISQGNQGKKRNLNTRKKISKTQSGKTWEQKMGKENSDKLKKMAKLRMSDDNHPLWKGGNSKLYYQKIARNNLNQECSWCGIKECLEVHHKDKNNKNNEINNLMMLCRNCHFKIHHQDKFLINIIEYQ